MKLQIKHVVLFLFLSLLFVGCFLFDDNFVLETQTQNTQNTQQGQIYTTQVVVSEDTLSSDELLLYFERENIPGLEMWEESVFVDYETGQTLKKEIYFKDDQYGITTYYILTGNTEPYIIEKRKEKTRY